MNRRGELLTTLFGAFSVILCLSGMAVNMFAGDVGLATYMTALACFLLLMTVYLEVYSHRG